jgi:hypothetical protein
MSPTDRQSGKSKSLYHIQGSEGSVASPRENTRAWKMKGKKKKLFIPIFTLSNIIMTNPHTELYIPSGTTDTDVISISSASAI